MTFSALHRAVGAPPGPFTNQLLDEAVSQRVPESDSLDWKVELPPEKNVKESDFPKDIAAMANIGGGVIVYGVDEAEKAATERKCVGDLSENHERTLRAAAATAVTPPLFNIRIHRLLGEKKAVVVEIPPSLDAPHLIYRAHSFGAPMRNDADTAWMQERTLAEFYRRRFEARREMHGALERLYATEAPASPTAQRAQLVAVAVPHFPDPVRRMTEGDAKAIVEQAKKIATTLVTLSAAHLDRFAESDYQNLRAGLRRWVAPPRQYAVTPGPTSIHFNGAISLRREVGGTRTGYDTRRGPSQVDSGHIEAGIVELLALVRASALASGHAEYDVRVGIEWSGHDPVLVQTVDGDGYLYDAKSLPLERYTPVDTTIDASGDPTNYLSQARELALDCINQGGILVLRRFES